MVGILLAVDAVKFDGCSRQKVWQEATNKGRAFNRKVNMDAPDALVILKFREM